MYIPIAGPWMHLSSAEDSPRDMALVIGSGVVQGVGALMTVASFVIPEKIPAATIQAGDVKMHVTPTSFGTASAGLGAVGQF